MSAALVTILLLVGGLVGGVVGWVAKRDEARRYIASRERYWAARVAELESYSKVAPPSPPATTVVQHFHMNAPSWSRPAAPVLDALVVRELPAGEVA